MPHVASYMQNSAEPSNCAAAIRNWTSCETSLLMAVASAHKAWTIWSSSCWCEGQRCVADEDVGSCNLGYDYADLPGMVFWDCVYGQDRCTNQGGACVYSEASVQCVEVLTYINLSENMSCHHLQTHSSDTASLALGLNKINASILDQRQHC